jgi:hypothetical protein
VRHRSAVVAMAGWSDSEDEWSDEAPDADASKAKKPVTGSGAARGAASARAPAASASNGGVKPPAVAPSARPPPRGPPPSKLPAAPQVASTSASAVQVAVPSAVAAAPPVASTAVAAAAAVTTPAVLPPPPPPPGVSAPTPAAALLASLFSSAARPAAPGDPRPAAPPVARALLSSGGSVAVPGSVVSGGDSASISAAVSSGASVASAAGSRVTSVALASGAADARVVLADAAMPRGSLVAAAVPSAGGAPMRTVASGASGERSTVDAPPGAAATAGGGSGLSGSVALAVSTARLHAVASHDAVKGALHASVLAPEQPLLAACPAAWADRLSQLASRCRSAVPHSRGASASPLSAAAAPAVDGPWLQPPSPRTLRRMLRAISARRRARESGAAVSESAALDAWNSGAGDDDAVDCDDDDVGASGDELIIGNSVGSGVAGGSVMGVPMPNGSRAAALRPAAWSSDADASLPPPPPWIMQASSNGPSRPPAVSPAYAAPHWHGGSTAGGTWHSASVPALGTSLATSPPPSVFAAVSPERAAAFTPNTSLLEHKIRELFGDVLDVGVIASPVRRDVAAGASRHRQPVLESPWAYADALPQAAAMVGRDADRSAAGAAPMPTAAGASSPGRGGVVSYLTVQRSVTAMHERLQDAVRSRERAIPVGSYDLQQSPFCWASAADHAAARPSVPVPGAGGGVNGVVLDDLEELSVRGCRHATLLCRATTHRV